ncbi:hypothetical protein Tco_1568860 [Tanacetum coccineum]
MASIQSLAHWVVDLLKWKTNITYEDSRGDAAIEKKAGYGSTPLGQNSRGDAAREKKVGYGSTPLGQS